MSLGSQGVQAGGADREDAGSNPAVASWLAFYTFDLAVAHTPVVLEPVIGLANARFLREMRLSRLKSHVQNPESLRVQ